MITELTSVEGKFICDHIKQFNKTNDEPISKTLDLSIEYNVIILKPKEYLILGEGTDKKVFVSIIDSYMSGSTGGIATYFNSYAKGTIDDNKIFTSDLTCRTYIKYPCNYSKSSKTFSVSLSGVYLVQTKFPDGVYVKIGRADNVKNRLSSLFTGNPFAECVGYINCKNTRELESKLHKQFSHLRYKGEWFTADDSIYTYFKEHPEFNILR